jgi:hypothetical protein
MMPEHFILSQVHLQIIKCKKKQSQQIVFIYALAVSATKNRGIIVRLQGEGEK